MEENKKELKQQHPNGAEGGNGGGRRRRHRHHKGGNGGNGGNNTPNNPVNNANNGNGAQKQQNSEGKNPAQAQNAQKQNQNQNQNHNQNGQNKKKNKDRNKQQNQQNQQNQSQQAQNQQAQQNNKGQKPQKPSNEKQNVAKEKEYVERNDKADKNDRKKDENRKDTYVYILDGNLYVNLTNKCSNACDFCVRNERDSYYGNYLWLRHGDPTVEKVIAAANALGDLTAYKEAVFCGFGEPTYKVAEIVALCDYFHEKGLKTRLNTNGQGNLINKRDIVPDLKGKVDFVNISLNASCVEKYQPVCRSQFGEAGFSGLIEFAKLCRRNGIACRFSIVDCIGEEEVEACKRLAQSVNVPLYVRDYITDS